MTSIERLVAAVSEAQARRGECLDCATHANAAGLDRVRQVQSDERNLRARRPGWRRQHRAAANPARDRTERDGDRPLHRPRQRAQQQADVLNGHAEQLARHDRGARADGECDVGACLSQLGGDFARGVAGPDDSDALAARVARAPVFDAVAHPAAEGGAIGELRHERVGDDARGDDERACTAGRAIGRAHGPFVRVAFDGRDIRARFDRHVERGRVGPQVLDEVGAAREEGRALRVGQARERGEVFAGVEDEAVVEMRPGVADGVTAFEDRVRDAGARELA